jgi:predicted RNA-binding protein with PUA-like domain
MATYLLKTEPGEYSFQDLMREKKCTWSGVSNNAALGHLRTMKKGDEAFIYHTGDEKAIVGLAVVASTPYEDGARRGKNDKGEPKFAVVDLKPVRAAKRAVTLAKIKGDKRFAAFALVKQSRLSVMPVAPELDRALREMAGL